MSRILFAILAATSCAHSGPDLANDTFPAEQAALQQRVKEIFEAGTRRDFKKLDAAHLYGPKFTEFKEGAPRGDAATNQQGEHAVLSMLEDGKVAMNDLKVDVFGDVAVVTFNGEFTGKIEGKPVVSKEAATMVFVKIAGTWLIAHEHFSALGAPPQG